jgi:inosose dehydratase
MGIRIGTNPIAWSNDDMRELGAEISLETCLSQAKAAGFEGIELGHKFPRTSAALRPILDDHGIALIGGWHSTQLLTRLVSDEWKAAEDHLALLKDMGCTVFIMAETSDAVHGERGVPLSRRPVLEPGGWAEFGRRMSEFSTRLRDQGYLPAFHHHMGTVVETAEEIARFMEETSDAVGLLLDTGHAAFAGAGPTELARTYGSRITHVHCKDIRLSVRTAALESDASFLDAVVGNVSTAPGEGIFTVPGDGDVDFASVLAEMKKAAYDGWLVVEAEQNPEKADPERYANLGFANLQFFATDAGLI